MSVESEIRENLKSKKLHMTLIDPDEQSPDEALDIASAAVRGGTDIILVGGSTVDKDQVDATCKILQENIQNIQITMAIQMCALKHFRIKLRPLYAGGGYKNST